MADRPILFSASMVRALLAGTKTQTRRMLKPAPEMLADLPSEMQEDLELRGWSTIGDVMAKLPYAVGDRLWAREAFAKVGDAEDDIHACPDLRVPVYYRADAVDPERQKWRSSIHMPRWASRLTLAVTDVRVQRLQEISEADAVAEGLYQVLDGSEANGCWTYDGAPDFIGCWDARGAYRKLWNSLHGPDAWDANPWVAAITFTVQHRNIDATPLEPSHA